MRIFFVESKFQRRLAEASKNVDDLVVDLTDTGRIKKITKIGLNFIIAYFYGKTVIVADHRNIALLFSLFFQRYFKMKILVMEDGFHTLMVDEYGLKHLFWNCSYPKAVILRLFGSSIVSLERYFAINNYCNKIQIIPSIDTNYTFFIDQPGLTNLKQVEKVKIKNAVSNIKFLLLRHPRSNFGCPENEPEFTTNDDALSFINATFIGYCSTMLLLALTLNRKVHLLPLIVPQNAPKRIGVYQADIQKYLIKHFPENVEVLDL